MDDVLIYSRTPEEHAEHLRLVFDRLTENGLFIQSPKLSLLVLISVPVLLIPLLRLSKHVRRLSRMVLSEQGKLAANIEESFAGVRTLYAYNQQDFAAQHFDDKMNAYVKHASTRLRLRSLFFALAIVMVCHCFALSPSVSNLHTIVFH